MLGLDEQGREILSYLEGEVPVYPTVPELWSEEVLEEVAHLLRRLHDATVGLEVAGGGWREGAAAAEGGEVICHNDVAHYNTVFQAGRPVALIDWDFAAPGPRIWDVASAAYRVVPLVPDQSAVGLGRCCRWIVRGGCAASATPTVWRTGTGWWTASCVGYGRCVT